MKLKNLTLGLAALAISISFGTQSSATVIYTELEEGIFTISGMGTFAGSDIYLSSLTVPPANDQTVRWTAGVSDYFILRDNDATSGARVIMQFSYSSWERTGSATAADSVIAVMDGRFVPRYTTHAISPSIDLINSATSEKLAEKQTFLVIADSTAAPAEDDSLYTFPNLSGNSMTASTSAAQTYFRSTASTPVKGYLRLDSFALNIEGGTAPGIYTNVLNVIITAGS